MKFQSLLSDIKKQYHRRSIQFEISVNHTVIAVPILIIVVLLLYYQFSANMQEVIIKENMQLVHQVSLNVSGYLRNMMSISDSIYYGTIKNKDIRTESFANEMSLLYTSNKDTLVSIACFSENGKIIDATPLRAMRKYAEVTEQEWFLKASNNIENLHFSAPHVQNLFNDSNYRYYWVISLSRSIQLKEGNTSRRGILLVDMNYSGIEQIFTQMTSRLSGYIYLISNDGEIIYHPQQNLIYSNLYQENNLVASQYSDGHHEEIFEKEKRQVIVKSVGYTGWKIISVIPNAEFALSIEQMRLFAIMIIGAAFLLLATINSFVSSRIATPLKRLEQSVKDLEHGNLNLNIYQGGSYEVAHLGRTIKAVVSQVRQLMEDIVFEQQEKRKSELDALQAQINPHFLYNTLDSIVWMIEDGRYEEAISMIKVFSSLFRLSLSKGNISISIEDELQHAENYLYIQKIRYTNSFVVEKDIDPGIYAYHTIKLVVQPLLENAIYHAMEAMPGDGIITIRGYFEQDTIVLEVRDNGMGMPQEKVDSLLSDEVQPAGRKGTGIGLKNVHKRLRLYYGDEYGLEIHSELDEGTAVKIRLPKDGRGLN